MSRWVYNTYPMETGRGKGREEGILDIADMCTVDVVMLSIASMSAAKEAWKSRLLMVPVGRGPGINPSLNDLHGIMLPQALEDTTRIFEMELWLCSSIEPKHLY